MRALLAAVSFVVAAAGALPARAEVRSASASAFVIQAEAEIAAVPEQVWGSLGQISHWWNGAHTYSGDAGRLQLDMQAGGCWCERWGEGQSVEHMRVVLVMEHEGVRTLRLVGGLGPLQEMGVSGVLTFTVAPHASGAKLTMTYRVSGDAGLTLDQLAPLVDMVLLEQFGRLSRFSSSGSPD
ncbi:MAG: SRPBCC domain-containing protein [Hyphomonadaceae bacterium]